jgi:hypothetical protein
VSTGEHTALRICDEQMCEGLHSHRVQVLIYVGISKVTSYLHVFQKQTFLWLLCCKVKVAQR